MLRAATLSRSSYSSSSASVSRLTCRLLWLSRTRLLRPEYHLQSASLNARHFSEGHREASYWLPEAYRGPPNRQASSLHSCEEEQQSRQELPARSRSNRRGIRTFDTPPSRRINEQLQSQQAAKEQWKKVLALQRNLLLTAKDYRACFSSDPLPIVDEMVSFEDLVSGEDDDYQKELEWKRDALRTIQRNLRQQFTDLHTSDALVDLATIKRTEAIYGGLCRMLQDIIKQSSLLLQNEMRSAETRKQRDMHGSAFNDDYRNATPQQENDEGPPSVALFDECTELAELALRLLAELSRDRILVVETMKSWSSNADQYHLTQYQPTAPKGEGGLVDTAMTRVKTMLNIASSSRKPSRPADLDDADSFLASVKNGMGVTDELFGTVIEMIRSQLTVNGHEQKRIEALVVSYAITPLHDTTNVDDIKEETEEATSSVILCAEESLARRLSIAKMAKRMVDLLDVMPSAWLPAPRVLNEVLQMAVRAGNLTSARDALATFQRHPTNRRRIRFSIVLQAYLEAVKHDPLLQNRRLAAREALVNIHAYWDTAAPGQLERVVHTSVVLKCLSILSAQIELQPGVLEEAELLVKRCVGGAVYRDLARSVEDSSSSAASGDSERGRELEKQIFPLLDSLVQLYARSPVKEDFAHAKNIVAFLMGADIQENRRSGLVQVVLPSNEASNIMVQRLNSILQKRWEFHWDASKRKEALQEEEEAQDLEFLRTLLRYMMRRRPLACWPSYASLEDYLSLEVKLPAKQRRAQEALSMMELVRLAHTGALQNGNTPTLPDHERCTVASMPDLKMYQKVLLSLSEDANTLDNVDDALRRALSIVDRLERVATPLIMNESEIVASSASMLPSLYQSQLRPPFALYLLVLQSCRKIADKNKFPRAAEIAVEAYQRLARRDLLHGKAWKRDVLGILRACGARLDDSDPDVAALKQHCRELLAEEGWDMNGERKKKQPTAAKAKSPRADESVASDSTLATNQMSRKVPINQNKSPRPTRKRPLRKKKATEKNATEDDTDYDGANDDDDSCVADDDDSETRRVGLQQSRRRPRARRRKQRVKKVSAFSASSGGDDDESGDLEKTVAN